MTIIFVRIKKACKSSNIERPVISFFQDAIVQPPFSWVLELGQGKVQLGAQDQGGWAIKINETIVSIQNKNDCTFILPILEANRKLFFDSLGKCPVALEQKNSFPEALLLSNAFSHRGSDYWAAKAIEWIDDDWREIPEMQKVFASVPTEKNWSQRVRHEFRKLKKKIEQESS